MTHQDQDFLRELKSIQVKLAEQVMEDEKVLEILKRRTAANKNLLSRLEENLDLSHRNAANTDSSKPK